MTALIFDLDGTLLDSLADIGGAVNEVLGEYGYPQHSQDDYRRMVGQGVEHLVRSALPESAHGRLDEMVAAYRDRYARRMTLNTRPYPGIEALLDALTARGVPMAVLSNKRDDFTVGLVSTVLGRWSFRDVRGERVGVPRKPNPTAAFQIAEKLRVPPARCLFIGDTAIDMKTAVAAGMTGIGVTWGFRGEPELRQGGARDVVHRPEQILELV